MQNPLMLLAAQERNQRNDNYRQMDKNSTPVFGTPFQVFRQGEMPMFSPMMPFLQPGMRPMNPNFRPSALENEDMCFPKRSINDAQSSPKKVDDETGVKECGTATPNSVYDISSEVLSESGESEGRWTPGEAGRPGRRPRKRPHTDGQSPNCPICGVKLRPHELESHVTAELERLEKTSRAPRRTPSRDGATPTRLSVSPSTSGVVTRRELAANAEAAPHSRYETYQRVKNNRQARLAAKTRCRKKRAVEETTCPVCSQRVTGTTEELNDHVEVCLKKSRDACHDDEGVVDVDGDGGPEYEEYTWAGQTRVRVSTMLDGGYKGAGFVVGTKSTEDEEANLDVDGDDADVYGKPQYSEADIIPCQLDESGDKTERERLRKEYLKTAVNQVQSQPSERNRWTSENDCSEPSSSGLDLSTNGKHFTEQENGPSSSDDDAHSRDEILESLRIKIKDQAALLQKKDNRFKCLICMDQFTIPLVSIQCWHVHCEECWLRTLGAKKLCPQCNMITSAADLRKIYL